MSDFHQNGIISTLHNFNIKTKREVEKELKIFSRKRPIQLILPSLFSEIKRPALKRIINELNKVDYIKKKDLIEKRKRLNLKNYKMS